MVRGQPRWGLPPLFPGEPRTGRDQSPRAGATGGRALVVRFGIALIRDDLRPYARKEVLVQGGFDGRVWEPGDDAEIGAGMNAPERHPRIIVGVDGSDSSISALRVARVMAEPLSATVEAWACWDVPAGYGVYLAVGIEGFKYAAEQVLHQALADAFGELPSFVHPRLVRGKPGPVLIDASRNASLLIVGRRGHGSFVPGSVSSACVSRAHCPVLVVHSPEADAEAPDQGAQVGAAVAP